ncbi:MAG: hypothetical protein MMC33_004849 [Icmadophila ericetorum]|nr:hypothetical protein [Icmadophila ericetorum]
MGEQRPPASSSGALHFEEDLSRRHLLDPQTRAPNAVDWSPYCSAVLRFQISFPVEYPQRPPSITVQSDIFHPLVTPLTTYTHTTGSSNLETVSATDYERLLPGSLTFRQKFPQWFERSAGGVEVRVGHGGIDSDEEQSVTSERDSGGVTQAISGGRAISSDSMSKSEPQPVSPKGPDAPEFSLCDVLRYMKTAFEDESVIDEVPLAAAGNTSAWHAWQAYRRATREQPSSLRALGGPSPRRVLAHKITKSHGSVASKQWNWDGVWEKRVKAGVNNSISDSVLYGSGNSDEMIHFLDINQEAINAIKQCMNDQ